MEATGRQWMVRGTVRRAVRWTTAVANPQVRLAQDLAGMVLNEMRAEDRSRIPSPICIQFPLGAALPEGRQRDRLVRSFRAILLEESVIGDWPDTLSHDIDVELQEGVINGTFVVAWDRTSEPAPAGYRVTFRYETSGIVSMFTVDRSSFRPVDYADVTDGLEQGPFVVLSVDDAGRVTVARHPACAFTFTGVGASGSFSMRRGDRFDLRQPDMVWEVTVE